MDAWIDVPAETWCRLDEFDDANLSAGIPDVLGTRIWDAQMSFRLRVGPLSLEISGDFCLPACLGRGPGLGRVLLWD